MGEYNTIKKLVIESCIKEGKLPSYAVLTELVLKHFPDSRWKKTHYTWYKSRIKKGTIQVPGVETEFHHQEGREKAASNVQVKYEAGLTLDEICLRISQGGSEKSDRILLFRLDE